MKQKKTFSLEDDQLNFVSKWQMSFKGMYEQIGEEMLRQSDKAFKTQSWDNNKWTKNKQGITPKLIQSGKMKAGVKYKVDNNGVTLYNDVNYAKYQQNGTNTIPSRQFMGNTDELEKFVRNLLIKEIKKTFK